MLVAGAEQSGNSPKLFVNPTCLVNAHTAISILLCILVLHLRFTVLIVVGAFTWNRDDPFYVMNVEADEEGYVFLKLERAIQSGERRERFHGVK